MGSLQGKYQILQFPKQQLISISACDKIYYFESQTVFPVLIILDY